MHSTHATTPHSFIGDSSLFPRSLKALSEFIPTEPQEVALNLLELAEKMKPIFLLLSPNINYPIALKAKNVCLSSER